MSELDKNQEMLLHRLFSALIQQTTLQKPGAKYVGFIEGDYLIGIGDYLLYDIGNGFVVCSEASKNQWFFPCNSSAEPSVVKEVIIHFDGASEGNPGHSGAGWVIFVNNEMLEGSEYLGIKTSNQAEYSALIRGVSSVSKQVNPEDVNISILGDSQLVIRHLTGEYQVRSKKLLPLYKQATNLLGNFNTWRCEWINRTKNRRADKLSKAAIKKKDKT